MPTRFRHLAATLSCVTLCASAEVHPSQAVNVEVSTVDAPKRPLAASTTPMSLETVRRSLQGTTLRELLRTLSVSRSRLSPDSVDAAARLVWRTYRDELSADPLRRREHESKQVTFGDSTMRYVSTAAGERPPEGFPLYIALHGGGGAPAQVNDGQWKQMQRYYRDSVTLGIYLAPRGVTDSWNLHWVRDAFICYDRIIENMIAFEQVDPNRVHLLGFSAGGDACYQVPARAPDRWAAVAMSAGHPNGVSPENYAALGFLHTLIQTLLDRGDPNYMFPVCLTLRKSPAGSWRLD